MVNNETVSHLPKEIVEGITGFKLCSFIIAYEGWRRGLNLRWYHDESAECKLSRLNSTTHGLFFSLDNGKEKHYFYRSRGDKVSNAAVSLVQDKERTKKILKEKGVSVPVGKTFRTTAHDEIINEANKIGYPVVVKPLTGSMGRGVFINIQDEEELESVLEYYKGNLKDRTILLEKHYVGHEYRFYVVGNKVASAMRRVPANVVGDGYMSIKELIDKKNMERKKNPYLAKKLIKIDDETKRILNKQSINVDYIPQKNEQVYLRELSNLSAGGDPIDCTNTISQEVKSLAVEGLKALPNIPHAGVDIIINPDDNTQGVILEVNATAEISFHSFPLLGEVHDVPKAIVDYYFPETINTTRSRFYFDYLSLLEPLQSLSANFIEVNPAPIGDLKGVKFQALGKVTKVGYMRWIRRNALLRGLYGYVKKINEEQVDVYVYGTDEKKLKEFEELCWTGSRKSRVDQVNTKVLNVKSNKYIKIGFRIYRGKSKTKKR